MESKEEKARKRVLDLKSKMDSLEKDTSEYDQAKEDYEHAKMLFVNKTSQPTD